MSHLILALQYCPIDFRQTLDLAKLMVEIEESKRWSAEIFLFERDDVTDRMTEELRDILDRRFRYASNIRSKRSGRDWPDGCNDLWQDCMSRLSTLIKKTRPDLRECGVLTFEGSDCTPMRPDWIDALSAAWEEAQALGKECCGSVGAIQGQPGTTHLNGNAIFRCDITSRHKTLQSSLGAWDYFHRKLLTKLAHPTLMIEQRYKSTGLTRGDIENIMGVNRPALLHGCKDGSDREAVLAMIRDGSFKSLSRTSCQPA